MHDTNFMTKRAKELMREKKALEEELSLAKSQGPSNKDSENQMIENMRKELDASQKAHRTTSQSINEI